MQGPPYRLYAASAFTMRSAPTSRGLSVWIDRPVRVPGLTTTAGKLKYRVTMSRSAVVELGTTEEMTTPVIWLENESPVWSRSPANSTASSSAVRSVSVDRRHWCSSSEPRNTPSTVFVFPTFTASSTDVTSLTGHPAMPRRGTASVRHAIRRRSPRGEQERVDQPHPAEAGGDER